VKKTVQKRKSSRSSTALSHPEDNYRRSRILAASAEIFGAAGFRVSLADIAEAAGILAGSLYHYFESKEAIVAELAKIYSAELQQVATISLAETAQGDAISDFNRIAFLAANIADCAVSHRAALLKTLYEYPADSGDSLVTMTTQAFTAVGKAMYRILREAQASGYLRANVDLGRLADRICRSMLYSAVGVLQQKVSIRESSTIRCRMLLEGVATDRPKDAKLNRSKALAAAEKSIRSWRDIGEGDESLDRLRVAARSEFGRQGYEATTIRDVAAAAGMSMGSVYRRISTKDEILEYIMNSFAANVTSSWDAVIESKSNPVEKLDALIWININALARFPDEFKIQLAWLRQSPPFTTAKLNHLTNNLSHMKAVLAEGEKSGDFQVLGETRDVRTSCLFGLTWSTEAMQRGADMKEVLSLARQTVICGAANR
jgi:AcrR family transcriptional regulator